MIKKITASIIVVLMVLCALPISANVITEEGKLPFSDAQSGWFVPAVEFCYVNGIMSGKSEHAFDPKGNTTREQMMTVLSMLDEDSWVYPQCSFEDVKEGAWYAPYVNKAVAKGYTSGISDTLFGIGKTLTRQEAVTLMYNYTVSSDREAPVNGDLNVFSDVSDVADWALDSFGWAVGKSIIAGSNGRLNPRNPITRAELAQMIKGFGEAVVFADCDHSFTEESCTLSAQCTLCGLKKGLPAGHSCPILNCTVGSQCDSCGEFISPKGHVYEGADCTKPMTCSVCNGRTGEIFGHTTDCGVCARCGIEIFENSYDKFVYYMEEKGMTDASWPGCKFLMANVTHPDGGTSTQYVKHYRTMDRTVFEIIYRFAGSNHTVRTTITMDFKPGSTYHVESYYSKTGDLQHADYYGSGNITAAGASFKLEGYSGDSAYRKQFEDVTKGTLLLNLDASNTLIKKYTGVSMSDFGFTDFN